MQTRPDVAFAASRLSEFLMNPSAQHLHLSQRVLEYLYSTKDLSIMFDGYSPDPYELFIASSDTSFANDPDTRRSSQAFMFSLYQGPIDWKAAKQRTVTTSSTEAELLALSTTAKQTIWWERIFDSIDFNPGHKTSI